MKPAFDILKGWSTRFGINGVSYGGNLDLVNDWRLKWHLETIGDVEAKTCLELGPLEGAHTMMLEAAGAMVTSIEGNENNFLKCLLIKNEFDLWAKFLFGDFCEYVKECNQQFGFVSAAGVLYHQKNPAELIYDLARITDTVLVWSQVASDEKPSGPEALIYLDYAGKINDYGNAAETTDNYCGGLNKKAFWMYPNEMLRCFRDAGFKNIIQNKECGGTIHGDSILFVARK